MPKRKDWWIIAIALLLALLLFVLTRGGFQPEAPGEGDPLQILQEIEPLQEGQGAGGEEAYLVVTVGDVRYRPLPLLREATYALRQEGGRENVFHVTRDSVYMQSASCDNQNCIHQGMATLGNMDTRVLGGMIICLPNRVVLELLTPEEANLEAE